MSAARKFLQIALLFIGMLALAFVSAVVSMKVVTWGRTVSVPDVRNKEVTAAIGELKGAGLEIKVERQEHHPTVPHDYIISQMPAPGGQVKKGRNVAVVVSLGSEEVSVPNLSGEALRRAQIALKQSGLTLGEVARVYSQTPQENVLLQHPAAQATLQKGMKVDLLVSDGPRPVRFVTPAVVGRTLAQASEAARPLGLKVSYAGKGPVVVSQQPRPGYPIPAGGDLTVTLGSMEPEQPVKKENGKT